MGNTDGYVWQEGLQFVLHAFDGSDTVIDEKDLAAPPLFAHDGVTDDAGVVFSDVSLDREAVRRRRFDDRHFPQVDQRHVKGPRNRRSTEGQDVDMSGPGLPFFFLGDAETLFFVDDEKAQGLEFNVLVEQAVSPDEDVDIAGQGPSQDRFLFFVGTETVEDFDVDTEGTEPFHKGLEVLLRQDRRRDQDGNLLTGCDGLKNGSHGHFRLAEADIAADQTVHGRRFFHAVLDFSDGF